MHRLVLAAIPLICLQSPCFAVEIGYKFSGTVFTDSSSPFGKLVPSDASVAGRFIYDTASLATHTFPECGDCTGYRQQIANGFFAKFGDVVVRADDYVVTISNDVEGFGAHPIQDVFDVFFDSGFDPSPVSPLVVDGDDEVDGLFGVSFDADSNWFTNSSLPNSPDLSEFVVAGGTLDDLNGSGAVFFIDNITRFSVLPGDYDMDGVVDSSDYSYWMSTFDSKLDFTADGNRNLAVDAADYTVWRDHFGYGDSQAMQPVGRTVPEPGSASLFIVGIAFFLGVLDRILAFRRGHREVL